MPEYVRPWLYPAQKRAIFDAPDCNGKPARISLVEASTKAGKAQPLDALVYTPTGPKRMGDIVLGDRVLTADGTASVIGVFPQGLRPIYRVEFSDGSVVEADEEHLWEVQYFRQKPVVLTTKQLMALPDWKFRKTWVPAIAVAQFEAQPVPVDPYLLGLLIGDGGLTPRSTTLSSADEEILDAVRAAIPSGYELKKNGTGYDWRITAGNKAAAQLREDGVHFRQALRELGMLCGSHEKSIPAIYRYNSEEVRRAILQGILDTDGFVDKHGQPGIEQTSQLLAEHISELVRSLGGTVLTRVRKVNGYRTKAGEFRQCRPVYRQAIRFADARWCFRLKRKAEKVRPKAKTGNRMLQSITFSRLAEAQCIAVDCPRHLYLTDCLVPTHNTSACIAWLFEQAIQGKEGDNFWWVAPVYAQAKIAFRRMKRGLPPQMLVANNQEMTITLPNGSLIWFKSADNPDNLYGDDVHAMVIDEASRVKEEAWHACRSVLTATRGPLRAIGNVKGRKNWFYQLARKAEAGEPGMSFAKLTAWDAVAGGVLAKDEIEDAKRLLPENVFKELYLAEASDDEGNPFGLSHIAACTIDAMPFTKPVAIGADLAKQQDWTVAIGLDQTGAVCGFERWQKKPWGETTAILTRLIGFTPALIDSTGVGDPIVEQLATKCRRASGYHFSAQSKQKLMEGLAVAIQSRKVFFPKGAITAELENFEYVYTRNGVKYSAPDGFHDDCVMALGLAVEQLRLVSPSYLTSAVPHSVPNPSPWLDNRVPNGEYYD